MIEQLARRQPGSFLTTYVDVVSNNEPRGGIVCIFQRSDSKLAFVHESDLMHYERLHNMLNDSKCAHFPLVKNFNPACRAEAAHEWMALEAARVGLKHKRGIDPYAGLSPYDIARKLFARLRSGIPPAGYKKPEGPG